MALNMWINTITGHRLDDCELTRLRQHAHVLYEANVHIFEDEREALRALGVEAMGDDLRPASRGRPGLFRGVTPGPASYAGICNSAGVIESNTSLAPGR